jgi:N-methylhydantoinase A/oxoprolinase/acetone carboxylase beta subunit
VCGYTRGIPYQQVLVPEWAAGFSAFGCACADFEYRYDRQVDLPLLPTATDQERAGVGALLTQAWRALEERVRGEFAKSGYDPGAVRFTHMVRMQYYGQLIDIEVDAPAPVLETAADMAALVETFEATYRRMYARSAGSPELGYLIAQAIVKGAVEVEKPTLPHMARSEGSPPAKGTRRVWWTDSFVDTDLYEMDDVLGGHTIEGPAVVEAESTTLTIPPDRIARLDEHGIFHLENRTED